MSPSFSGIPDCIGLPAILSLDTSLRRLIELRDRIPRDLGRPNDCCKASLVGTSGPVFTSTSRQARMAFWPLPLTHTRHRLGVDAQAPPGTSRQRLQAHSRAGRALARPPKGGPRVPRCHLSGQPSEKQGWALCREGKKPQGQRLKNRPIATIRDMLEYFDKDMNLDRKRDSWEPAQTRQWRHCMDNPSAFVTFSRRVLEGVTKDIARKAGKEHGGTGNTSERKGRDGAQKDGLGCLDQGLICCITICIK